MFFTTITSDRSIASKRRLRCVLCYMVFRAIGVDLLAFTGDCILGTKPADKSGCPSLWRKEEFSFVTYSHWSK